ncbi:MucR family transcriptional regulator [Sphingomonas kaistensis]|uniref:MucR family transcriptional regulator n=1 Tax=Sphingomonas kaistensis TaxID=298708 RepID=A0ABZ2G6I0_9SPHN
MEGNSLIRLTTIIVSSYVANNGVAANDVAKIVTGVHGALSGLKQPQKQAVQPQVPVTSIQASVKPEHIVCLGCGKKQKLLKRHLRAAHGLTPNQYRAEYHLPREYPMTSPNYSARRSDLARATGLGRRKMDAETTRAPAKGTA